MASPLGLAFMQTRAEPSGVSEARGAPGLRTSQKSTRPGEAHATAVSVSLTACAKTMRGARFAF
eukprot:341220-Chlamydomonas_euryale.AAC.1